MFFSEEQKKSLKDAYAADPYPSQSTLDELACNLGVATKTVINWFHNYRMRAKQQTNNSTTPMNSFNCQNSSASSEDKSQSEMLNYYSEDDKENAESEITVDDESSPGTNFHCSLMNTNLSENVDCDFGHEGQSNQDDYVVTDEQVCVKDEINLNDTEHFSKMHVICKNQNKRKSNKPQWVYEGTQLERNMQDNTDASSDNHGAVETFNNDKEADEKLKEEYEEDAEKDVSRQNNKIISHEV